MACVICSAHCSKASAQFPKSPSFGESDSCISDCHVSFSWRDATALSWRDAKPLDAKFDATIFTGHAMLFEKLNYSWLSKSKPNELVDWLCDCAWVKSLVRVALVMEWSPSFPIRSNCEERIDSKMHLHSKFVPSSFVCQEEGVWFYFHSNSSPKNDPTAPYFAFASSERLIFW